MAIEPREYDVSKMSPCAQAYVAEYGSLPANREEQDRYSHFRFGWEAGARSGAQSERARIARLITVG